MEEKIMLKNVRVSFIDLVNPKGFEGGTPKYKIKILIPKNDKEQAQQLINFANTTIDKHAKWSTKTKANVKTLIKKQEIEGIGKNYFALLKDGDMLNQYRKDEGQELYRANEGNYVITASRSLIFGPTIVVDQRNKKLTQEEVQTSILPGYWVNVQCSAYCWDMHQANKRGFSLTLQAVQLVKEDEVFGPESPFEEIEGAEIDDDDTNPFDEEQD